MSLLKTLDCIFYRNRQWQMIRGWPAFAYRTLSRNCHWLEKNTMKPFKQKVLHKKQPFIVAWFPKSGITSFKNSYEDISAAQLICPTPPTYKLIPLICPKFSVVHLKEERGMRDCSICNCISVYPHNMEPLIFLTNKLLPSYVLR